MIYGTKIRDCEYPNMKFTSHHSKKFRPDPTVNWHMQAAYEKLSMLPVLWKIQEGKRTVIVLGLRRPLVLPQSDPAQRKPVTFKLQICHTEHNEVHRMPRCLKNRANTAIEKLDVSKKVKLTAAKITGCENPDGCVCKRRLEHLFSDLKLKNFKANKEGFMDVSKLKRIGYRFSSIIVLDYVSAFLF